MAKDTSYNANLFNNLRRPETNQSRSNRVSYSPQVGGPLETAEVTDVDEAIDILEQEILAIGPPVLPPKKGGSLVKDNWFAVATEFPLPADGSPQLIANVLVPPTTGPTEVKIWWALDLTTDPAVTPPALFADHLVVMPVFGGVPYSGFLGRHTIIHDPASGQLGEPVTANMAGVGVLMFPAGFPGGVFELRVFNFPDTGPLGGLDLIGIPSHEVMVVEYNEYLDP